MFSNVKRLGMGIVVATVSAASISAQPVAFGSNYYEFVLVQNPFVGSNNLWSTASAGAAARSHLGQSGHLATVGSQAENDFLLSLTSGFTGFNGAWLGGRAPGGWLEGPEAGQGFTYTNWGGQEPNNAGFAYMNIGTLFAGIAAGQWADDSGVQGQPEAGLDPVVGYFVEYEGGESVVPEPGTIVLLTLGLAGVLLAKRNRRKA